MKFQILNPEYIQRVEALMKGSYALREWAHRCEESVEAYKRLFPDFDLREIPTAQMGRSLYIIADAWDERDKAMRRTLEALEDYDASDDELDRCARDLRALLGEEEG